MQRIPLSKRGGRYPVEDIEYDSSTSKLTVTKIDGTSSEVGPIGGSSGSSWEIYSGDPTELFKETGIFTKNCLIIPYYGVLPTEFKDSSMDCSILMIPKGFDISVLGFGNGYAKIYGNNIEIRANFGGPVYFSVYYSTHTDTAESVICPQKTNFTSAGYNYVIMTS